jgi:hypothetical protein
MNDDPVQTEDLNVLFQLERLVAELFCRITKRLNTLPDHSAALEIRASCETLRDLAMHLHDVAQDKEIDYTNELRDVFAVRGGIARQEQLRTARRATCS